MLGMDDKRIKKKYQRQLCLEAKGAEKRKTKNNPQENTPV